MYKKTNVVTMNLQHNNICGGLDLGSTFDPFSHLTNPAVIYVKMCQIFFLENVISYISIENLVKM